MDINQKELAERFRSLHEDDGIFVLLNAWDAGSARVFERLGAVAVGTTSMGIAAGAGYGDGEILPSELMLDAIGTIAASIRIPVTADIEKGYAESPEAVVNNLAQVLERGAVGVNIEDSYGAGSELAPIEILEEKLRAIRAHSLSIRPLLNARVDVYVVRDRSDSEMLREAIERGNRYRAAGADCIFVPGGLSRDVIATLVREIDAPINVVANPSTGSSVPPVSELADLGVRRVSVGSGIMRATLSFARRIADEILTEGTYTIYDEELRRPEASETYRMAIGEC